MANDASSASNNTPAESELKTYYGNCHCGLFKFHVTIPPLGSKPLHACRCSICAKKGTLFVFPKKSDIVFEKGGGKDGLGEGVLSDYDFNSKQLWHRFCPSCGNAFGIVHKTSGSIALNTRLFRDVDIWSLPVHLDDGPVTPLHFELSVFPGLQELESQLEAGEKIYTGSCHCKAITYGMRTIPLDNHEAPEIKECDCSICIRTGEIRTYPTPLSRVSIHHSDPSVLKLYIYPLGRKWGGLQFCSICGCHLFGHLVGPPPEFLKGKPHRILDMVKKNLAIKPVNLRSTDLFLGLTQEDRDEWEIIEKRKIRETGSKDGMEYVVPE